MNAKGQNPFVAAAARAEEACGLNFTTPVATLPISAAEVADLKPKEGDAITVPNAVATLNAQRVAHMRDENTFRRWWLTDTRQHIDRTCVRMWRPKKRLRRELREATEVAKMELFAQLYPHPRLDLNEGQNPIHDVSGEREVLVPSLVAFISRGASAGEGGPKAEIKYLAPGERVDQDSATICQALTDSFVCKRVSGPDIANRWASESNHMRRRFVGKFADPRLAPGEYSNTILIFATGVVVVGKAGKLRGGIGLLTKDTVHYHEEQVQMRVLEAEERLAKADTSSRNADLHKIKLCMTALKKRNRGHGRNLYVAGVEPPTPLAMSCPALGGVFGFVLEARGPQIHPEQFGFVKSRYVPAWKTRYDEDICRGVHELVTGTPEFKEMLRSVKDNLAPNNDVEDADGAKDKGKGVDKKSDDSSNPEAKNKDGAQTDNLANMPPQIEPKDGQPGPSKPRIKPQLLETAHFTVSIEPAGPSTTAPATNNTPAAAKLTTNGKSTKTTKTSTTMTPKNGDTKAHKPTKKPLPYITPLRASARALLAAIQIHPFDFSHCTRLVLATSCAETADIATNRLHGLLERGLPLRTAKGAPFPDADLWWAFAGTVKDLAYQGVDVVVTKVGEGDGIYYMEEGEWNPEGKEGVRDEMKSMFAFKSSMR
ncbi:hypothetical protein N0V88_005977 [Collariella sp. IMI 366227]|nr:hypothetical protein N0V88_005977 [Collariella sp. IMI 366227]